MAVKNIIHQSDATVLICVKVLAVLFTIAFTASLQMSTQWKRKKNLYYENSFDLPDHLISGTHTGPQNSLKTTQN